MFFMATISTHNGSKVHQAHNGREQRCVEKEAHIDTTKVHEIWKDESISHAYHRLFDGALERYNEKQTRTDRKIENYLTHVKQDAKMHTAYELVVGVYGDDVPKGLDKKILIDYVTDWQKRNPQLELIGAYYHHDEQGSHPHVHIDYIPVATGYKKGLEVQAGLSKALEQQGVDKGPYKTLQIAWEHQENAALESICERYGVHVEHPQAGKGTHHAEKELYIMQEQMKDLQGELVTTVGRLSVARKTLSDTESDRDSLVADIDALSGALESLSRKADELTNTIPDVSKPAGIIIGDQLISALEKAYDAGKKAPSDADVEEAYRTGMLASLADKFSQLSPVRAIRAEMEALKDAFENDLRVIKANLSEDQQKALGAIEVYTSKNGTISDKTSAWLMREIRQRLEAPDDENWLEMSEVYIAYKEAGKGDDYIRKLAKVVVDENRQDTHYMSDTQLLAIRLQNMQKQLKEMAKRLAQSLYDELMSVVADEREDETSKRHAQAVITLLASIGLRDLVDAYSTPIGDVSAELDKLKAEYLEDEPEPDLS